VQRVSQGYAGATQALCLPQALLVSRRADLKKTATYSSCIACVGMKWQVSDTVELMTKWQTHSLSRRRGSRSRWSAPKWRCVQRSFSAL